MLCQEYRFLTSVCLFSPPRAILSRVIALFSLFSSWVFKEGRLFTRGSFSVSFLLFHFGMNKERKGIAITIGVRI